MKTIRPLRAVARAPAIVAAALFSASAASAVAAVINIGSFGAIANDAIDDTTAINNAITAARAGDTIFMPAGTFNISQKIVARTNITLAGAGLDTTTLRFGGSASAPLLDIENVSNVECRNFTLDGNNSTAATQGIYAHNASTLSLHDLAVKNLAINTGFSPHAIYFDTNVVHSLIQNTTLSNIGLTSEWGAGIRLGHGSSFNRVLNNTISNTGRGGILADDGSTDLIIRNNTVTGSGGEGLGIELQTGCDRAIVEDNNIDHWLSVDASNFCSIRRNNVSDKTGVYKYAGLELVDAHDDLFADNVIDSGQQLGISISGPQPKTNCVFLRNIIKNPSTWGVQVQGDAGGASQLYFYKNAFSGAMRSSPATLFAPQGNGIRVNGDANNVVFDSNQIQTNQGAGVQVVGSNLSNLTFKGNQITDNSLQAVTSSITVPGTVWDANYIKGNSPDNSLSSTKPYDAGPASIDALVETATVGMPIQFSIGIDGDPTALVHALWDFGDGIPATETQPVYTYSKTGVYHVTAVGWDAAGHAILGELDLNVILAPPGDLPEPAASLAALSAAACVFARRRQRRDRERRVR